VENGRETGRVGWEEMVRGHDMAGKWRADGEKFNGEGIP